MKITLLSEDSIRLEGAEGPLSIEAESCAACGLGAVYYKSGRTEAAEQAFKRSMSLDPGDACAYQQAGRMYYELGCYQDAVAALIQAIKLNPNASDYLYLGNAYIYLAQFEAATNAYQGALSLDPSSANAYRQLGFAYGHLRRLTESARAFRQAIRLRPDDAEAMQALAVVYLALGDEPAALAQYAALRQFDQQRATRLLEIIRAVHAQRAGTHS